MPHLPLRFALLASLLSAPAANAQITTASPGDIGPFSPASTCTEGAREPVTPFFPDRLVRIAHCAYGRAELVERFARLLESKAPRLELESVERMFGLPPLETSYPSRRSAWFDLKLRGGQGGDEWIAFVNFREGFYPLNDSRPRRLTEGKRPARIDPDDHGSILFSLRFYEDRPKPGSPQCIPVSMLYDRAIDSGWEEDTQAGYSSHMESKSVVMIRGDRTYFPDVTTAGYVATRADIEATCFNEGRIDQEPTKPEPPLSAEEEASIDRRRREAQAGEAANR